jgi:HEAT repeat protein
MDQSESSDKQPGPAGGVISDHAVSPMTPTLMARLFIVPAVIVCLLLGVAVVVVLFGSTSIDKQETIADLLTKLESDTGERTLGAMLMPKAKEYWQAAQELAQRLSQKDKFLKPDEIEPAAKRLIAMLNKLPPGRDVDEPGETERVHLSQQYFMMIALGRLGSPSGVEPLVRLSTDPFWGVRRTALQGMAEMAAVPAARQALPAVLARLEDPKPAVQIVACATLAALADRGDAATIRALSAKLEADRELQWNAAMTLARLGDRAGKLVLMNMLERGYWERLDLEYQEAGSTVRRKYTDVEVANNLKSAIEAASHLQDAELADLVTKLENDKAVVVRDAARAASAKMAPQSAAIAERPGAMHRSRAPSDAGKATFHMYCEVS